jgi:hypothetical protein
MSVYRGPSTPEAREVSTGPEPAGESLVSGISWAAVFAGAAVTAAIGLTLMALGAGMGLSSISMWPSAASASRVAPAAAGWIVFVQLVAGALGGYLAGRLRTKWVQVHTHEVFFRDTAHGLLAWSVSVVLTIGLLGAMVTSLAGDLAGRSKDGAPHPSDYYADSLFRSPRAAAEPAPADLRGEAAAILAHALAHPAIESSDRAYLAELVSARTGLSRPEAERRVDMTVANARVAAEEARRALAHALYWLVVALLVGAFAASCAAVLGGRRRDFVWK